MYSCDSSVVFKIHKGWKIKGHYKIHCTFSSSSRSSHILYALIMGHLMCFLKCLTSFQIFDADHHCHHQKNFRLVILYQLPTKYTFRYWHIQSENKIFCQISDSYSFLKMNYLSSFTFFHSFYTHKKNLEILVLSKNCSTIYCIICQYKINLKARKKTQTKEASYNKLFYIFHSIHK